SVAFAPYGDFAPAVEALASAGKRLWLDPAGTSQGVRLLCGDAPLVTRSPNPVVSFKAVKNPVEITVAHEAHLRAGCAKVRSFSHLEAL
ncbi:MAG: aminopeptidase P family protein, partial [Gammaproteobacteria bacterium]|nr:aminopeptidase P family protein [Gammaproteobacteria bacterium]